MIDMVHNDVGGFCLVHDEPDLDAVRSVVIDGDGRLTFVTGEGDGRRSELGLPADLLASARSLRDCAMVRMSGARPVSERTVRVRHSTEANGG